MGRTISLEEARSNLEALLQAVANGDEVAIAINGSSITLVESAAHSAMAEKAASYDARKRIMMARLEEARSMTFEVDPEDEESFLIAEEAVASVRTEMRAEKQSARAT
ncbi:MAG TPA: hypothetical protein PJ994_10690 [Tepidiformaceae bacterium]|nr:hypothetical protein [Tepidiformaceae bacterium]HMO95407.1 hypothetical protein [Tepidiformaceae bacterium]